VGAVDQGEGRERDFDDGVGEAEGKVQECVKEGEGVQPDNKVAERRVVAIETEADEHIKFKERDGAELAREGEEAERGIAGVKEVVREDKRFADSAVNKPEAN
jgi:hypothetical protein